MLLGPLLPEDAFEPCKVSMAISACWPGDTGVVPEAAALKSGEAHSFWELTGLERFACYCEVQRGRQIWKSDGSILARVQGPTYPASYSSHTFSDGRALLQEALASRTNFSSFHFSYNSMAESAAIHTRPDTKMYYLFNKVNVQGESRQPWHLEGPHEAPRLFISQRCYQEKSLRLSMLYLLLVLSAYAMAAATIRNRLLFMLLWSTASRGLSRSISIAADPLTNLGRK